MKRVVFIVAFFFAGTLLYAQDGKIAKIEFKTDVIDYGEVAKGSNGVRFFEFTNTGDAPLVISKVTSSCGCTIPSWTTEPVMPGKSGKIEVKYDTNRPGPIRKTVTVTSNAETPNVALKIKGTVIEGDSGSR